jgi:hypothetical protein
VINKKAVAILLISTILASAVVAMDLKEYKDWQVPRYANGVSLGDSIFVVYQDYRNLYASVGLVEWNLTSDTASSKVVVEEGWDHIRPKIFTFGNDLILGWIELHEDGERFGYAQYDPKTGSVGERASIEITAEPFETDFSFEGTNFTVATLDSKNIHLWTVDVTTGDSSYSVLELERYAGALSVTGSTLYYPTDVYGGKVIKSYQGGQTVVLGNASGSVIFMTGFGEYAALIELAPGENWGRVRFTGPNGTATFPVVEYADNVDISVHQGNIYVSWNEELEEEGDNDMAMEVRVAVISNATDPEFTLLGEASALDGRFSSNQFMVEHNGNLHVIWIDRTNGYSLRSARIHDGRLASSKEILGNGELPVGIIMVLGMAVAMGPIFGFLAFIYKGEPKKPGKKRAALKFLVYNRRESYLFLKFYFAIVPFLFVIGIFSLLFIEAGAPLGFRVGYGSVINNCIAMVVSLVVLVALRTEAKVSQNHRTGYAMLQASFVIALFGLLWYEFSKDVYNPQTIYIVYGTGLLSPILALAGPMVMLTAVTKKKAYLIPAIPFLVILLLSVMDFANYSAAVLFPSISSPTRLISQSSLIINLMGTMVAGMMLAMTLFESLTLEKFKSISQWTKRDLDSIRNRAMGMGLIMAGAISAFSIYTASIIFIPDLGFILANSFIIIMVAMVSFLIAGMTIPMYKGDFFVSKFKDSPSKAIYTIYCQPIMILIAMMIFAVIIGVLGLLVMGIYAYAMYKSDRLYKDMSSQALKDAAEEEGIEEEEELGQITRSDVGLLVKRNLKYLIFAPPVVAMILLPLWKLNILLPQLRALVPQDSIFVDIGVIVISSLMFIELWYARWKMSKAKELMDFVGLSSGGGGIVFPVVLMFFYAVGGGNLFTLLVMLAMLQLNTVLYITLIYPPLLKKLNQESKDFYMVPEMYVPFLKVLKKSDERLYAIPGEKEEEVQEGEEAPAAEGAPVEVSADEGKGALVSVEPPESLELRKKDMKSKGAMVAVLGIIIAAVGLLLPLPGGFTYTSIVLTAMFPLIGILFVFIGLYFRKYCEKFEPMVVYENGMDITMPGADTVFHPFEGFLTAQTRNVRGRNVLVLRGAMAVHSLTVWPEIEEFVKTIPEKVGKDPDKMPVGAGYQTKNVERIKKLTFPISLGTGFVFALVVALTMGSILDPVPAFLAVFPILSMFMFTFVSYSQRRLAKRLKKPNLHRRLPVLGPDCQSDRCIPLSTHYLTNERG